MPRSARDGVYSPVRRLRRNPVDDAEAQLAGDVQRIDSRNNLQFRASSVVPRSALCAPEQRTWQGPQPHSSPTTLNAFAISVVPNPWAFSLWALAASIEEADPWSRPRPLPWRCPQAVARGAGWSRTRRTHRASRGSTCRPRRRCRMGCSVAFNGAPGAIAFLLCPQFAAACCCSELTRRAARRRHRGRHG
jgi:hypothetical protein